MVRLSKVLCFLIYRNHIIMKIIKSSGFTYLSLLIFIAIISLYAAATTQIGAIQYRKNAEEELLAIGKEYRRALISYAIATPPGSYNRPSSLDELLMDTRFPIIKRHLRKIYFDPITGDEKWGVIMSKDGQGILGVHSLSQSTPIKIGNFPLEFDHFKNQQSYLHWVFSAEPIEQPLQ
jgi:type II secretory pathway pseudopilin PulG